MIKILYVVLGTNLNGTERYVVDIARNLPKDKYDVCIATPMKSNLSKFLEKFQVKEFVFDNGTVSGFSLKGIVNIFKFIYKQKIDIVHSNSGILPCIIGKVFFNKVCFETRHGLFYTKKQLKNLSFKRKIVEYLKQYFVNYEIAISENDKKMMNKYFGIRNRKIKLIYNGIAMEDFIPFRKSSDYSNDNKLKLVNVGRMTFQKAQDVLLDSVNLLKKNYQNFSLTIIGEGKEKNNLLKYVKENSLENFVNIEYYKEDIFDYLRNFDILILSSRFEGIPYIMLESMAIGLPVIVTDVGGISNVIKNDINGILVKEESPEDIKNAILSIVLSDNKYKILKENAYKSIENYSLKKMVDDYMSFYDNYSEN